MRRSEASLAEARDADRRTPLARKGRRRREAAGPLVALRRAVVQVLSEGADLWGHAALSAEEGDRLAGDLVSFLMAGEVPGEATHDGAERTLICRFIDLTRAKLLDGDYGITDADLLLALRKLEDARERFEPEWHQGLAARLTGANSLDLVVELVHDLRSPLTSIMFLSETLRKGQSGQINEVQRKQLGIVYSAALGLVSVANDVLDLARDNGRDGRGPAEPRERPFSVYEVVESVREMVGPMAEEKRLDLTFLTPEHDIRVGLPVPLSRVLLNLTTNAIKFTDEGSVAIVARETAGSRVEFSVRDTGRGMDDETLAHMFEPFRRSRSETGFHFSGTGLGLAISRRMVEVMGGTLEVETGLEKGTRFYFEVELPRGSRI